MTTWIEALERIKRELANKPPNGYLLLEWEGEPIRYTFKQSADFPGKIEVAVFEEDDNIEDPNGWSCYYPALESFDKYCADGALEVHLENIDRHLQSDDLTKLYKPEPAITTEGQMAFKIKDERIIVLSENCGAKFRKYVDRIRNGNAPHIERELLANPAKTIFEMTKELPIAIYKTRIDFFMFHTPFGSPDPNIDDDESIEGRLPKWMKRSDFDDPFEWELTKTEYGVD